MRFISILYFTAAWFPLSATPTVANQFDVIRTIPDPEKRLNAWNTFADDISIEQIQASLQRISSLPEWRDRAVLQMSLLRRWANLEPSQAGQFVARLPPGQFQQDCAKEVFPQWFQKNLPEAATHILQLPHGTYRRLAANLLMENWGEKDPQAAWQWTENLNSAEREEVRHSLLFVWVHQDPIFCWEKIAALPTGPIRQMLVTNAAMAWTKHDLASALAWSESLHNNEEKQLAQSAVAEVWANRDPLAAAQFATSFPPGQNRLATLAAVTTNWALQNPRAAGNWLAANPPIDLETRSAALHSLMNLWAERDPLDAASWIHTLPRGRFRDDAIQHFAPSATRWAPECTASLALTISSEPLRRDILNSCLQQWQTLDAPAMRFWLSQKLPANPTTPAAVE